MPLATTNPLTGETVRTFEPFTNAQLEAALARAAAAFANWRTTTLPHRAERMRRAAALLRERQAEYAALMTLEMGKVRREARAEVEKCALVCDYYAEHAARFLADEPVETEARKSVIAFEPLGPVLAVMPWNFPFWQVFRFAAPTLMAGNTGLLKHASNVPQCAAAIEAVLHDAGVPAGAFVNLPIPSDRVGNVIADARVRAVTVTGSEPAGRSVAAAAGQHLKPSVLELGGSDAFVVLADADLDAAAQTAVQARMINTGQSCIAAKRFIVVAEVAEAFLEKLRDGVEALRMGDPTAEDTDYGPMARADLADELAEQVERSVAAGARVVCGGRRPDRAGAFYEATVLADVRPGTPAFDEELFGPVAAVVTAHDEADAVRLANHSDFGLGGAVWTRDVARGEHVARQIEAGAVFVNGLCRSDPRVPFGGVKNSGYGRELSYPGIRAFVNVKTLWVE